MVTVATSPSRGRSRVHTSDIFEPQPLDNFDLGTMAKEKSEKKKKQQVSGTLPAAVEEDVEMGEMEVSGVYVRPRR